MSPEGQETLGWPDTVYRIPMDSKKMSKQHQTIKNDWIYLRKNQVKLLET